jgi:hypothetical protein
MHRVVNFFLRRPKFRMPLAPDVLNRIIELLVQGASLFVGPPEFAAETCHVVASIFQYMTITTGNWYFAASGFPSDHYGFLLSRAGRPRLGRESGISDEIKQLSQGVLTSRTEVSDNCKVLRDQHGNIILDLRLLAQQYATDKMSPSSSAMSLSVRDCEEILQALDKEIIPMKLSNQLTTDHGNGSTSIALLSGLNSSHPLSASLAPVKRT